MFCSTVISTPFAICECKFGLDYTSDLHSYSKGNRPGDLILQAIFSDPQPTLLWKSSILTAGAGAVGEITTRDAFDASGGWNAKALELPDLPDLITLAETILDWHGHLWIEVSCPVTVRLCSL